MYTNISIGKLWSLGILRVQLTTSVVNELVKISDDWINKKIDWSNNLAGAITSGSQYKFEFPDWFDIRKVVHDYLNKEFGNETIQTSNIALSDSWVVSQLEGDYNPIHSHGSWMSGIVYLKVPEQICKIPNSLDGCVHFVLGNYHEPSLQNFGPKVIYPKVGEMYIFPGYLLHTVYPFKGSGERRSLSFNLDLI